MSPSAEPGRTHSCPTRQRRQPAVMLQNQYCTNTNIRRWTYGKLVGSRIALLALKVVERGAELGQQRREGGSKRGRVGVLEVDIDAVEAVILNQLYRVRDERRTLRGVGHEVEVACLRISPAADGEEHLEVPVWGMECNTISGGM